MPYEPITDAFCSLRSKEIESDRLAVRFGILANGRREEQEYRCSLELELKTC